jgi:hypothetical protein
MDRVRVLFARLRRLFGKATADRQLDDEIALHLELETEKNMHLGMPPAEAHRRALLLVVAGIATWIPAARASRADPMESLRME